LRLEGTRLMLVLLDQGDCIDPQYGLRSFASRSQTADGAWSNGDLLALPAYQYYDASCNQTSLKVSGPNSQLVRFLGTVTADCFRFTSKIMRIPATQTAPARDVQYVVLGAH